MKAMRSEALLEELKGSVRDILLQAQQLKKLSVEELSQVPAPGKWSVAQVLEHLNFYARHYLPAIEEKLHLHQTTPAKEYKPGWLGNYFANLMKPGQNGTIAKKMKAPKNAVPSLQPDAKAMLEEFIAHQHQLLNLLQISATANLSALRIPTSLSQWIRLKLGDTYRFFIAHEERHFVQIRNTLAAIPAKSGDGVLHY